MTEIMAISARHREVASPRRRSVRPLLNFGLAVLVAQIFVWGAMTMIPGSPMPMISGSAIALVLAIGGALAFAAVSTWILIILPLAAAGFLIPLGIARLTDPRRSPAARRWAGILLQLLIVTSVLAWWQWWDLYLEVHGWAVILGAFLIHASCAAYCSFLLWRAPQHSQEAFSSRFPYVLLFWLLTVWIPLPFFSE